SYAWGMASTPATLWLGLAAAALADAIKQQNWRQIARRCWLSVLHHATPAGLVAEMFDAFGANYWAVGHSWSSAWLLLLTEQLLKERRASV
ncbi:MAG: hypothetical protein ACUVSC_00875, partial [Candidatus Fervidibacter sp.]